MKNNLIKRTLGCVLVGTMVMGSTTGCGNGSNATDASEAKSQTQATTVAETAVMESASAEVVEDINITYPLNEDVTLTIAYTEEGAVTANYKDFTETPFWKAWQEKTGIKLEAMELTSEAFDLMLISGELPDLIFMKPYSYPGGPSQAIEDQVIEPLTDYMQYAPDLMAVLESNEDYRRANTTSHGDIIGAPFIRGDEYLLTSFGTIIRADWLEELNMENPKTPEQFYDVLVAFKEKMGAEVPLSGRWRDVGRALLTGGGLTNAYGIPSAEFYQVDGTVHYGYTKPEMKEVFAYLNKLYNEGLLDPDFATIDANGAKNNILNGRSGVAAGAVGGAIGTYMKIAMTDNPDYALTGVPTLVSAEGETREFSCEEFPVPGHMYVMTPQCENKEAAVKFLNYGYTEEGGMFFNYGVEGESYTMVDGYPTYTEWVLNNPDGWTMQQALAAYCRSWAQGPFVQQKEYFEQFASMDRQKEAVTTWTDTEAAAHILPLISIAAEDSSEYSKIESEIKTFVSEMSIAYITGAKSLDGFESEFLATLESLDVDRMIEIKQNALGDYNAR